MDKFFTRNDRGEYVLIDRLTYDVLAHDWRALLQSFFAENKEVVLNFKNIVQVDSSFLAFLLALVREAHHQKVVVKIKHMTHDIKSLMQVQGIWPLFEALMD